MLSREEVLRIAQLARLELTEEEVKLYQNRLGRVLDYIQELREVSTPENAFVRHVPKDCVFFRADHPVAFKNPEILLVNSPALEGNHFLLPQIVEHS